MDKKQDYGSRLLYAEDLIHGGDYVNVTVEVSAWHEPNTIKAANGKMVDKPCIEFKGKSKMLALCKTNIAVGKYLAGEQEGPLWIGKKFILEVRIVDAYGSKTPAIRFVPPIGGEISMRLKPRLGTKATLTPNKETP